MTREPRLPVALLRGSLSRRTLFQGAGAVALGAFATACGTKGTSNGSAPAKARAAADTSDTDKVVNWSNWPEYIDVDDKTKARPTLDAFTKATGIKVTYTEDYNDN